MRPYLAVIKDSFREAFASWVLWIVLILILLLLLAIAPLGYRTVPLVRLQSRDVQDPLGLVEELVAARGNEDTPAGHIAGMLTNNLNDRLQEMVEAARSNDPVSEEEAVEWLRGFFRTFGELLGTINNLLYDRDFFDEAAWSGVPLGAEAEDLLDRGLDDLSDEEAARLNRLAFDAAFADYVKPAGDDAISIVYLNAELFNELPVAESLLQNSVSGFLTAVVNFLVGVFGVIVALVVTSFIVPRMLDSGAVDLLLSKPVSRPLLLLSKFAGGCAFILLCTAFLNTGLWLIIGLRFGIWNSGLLWAILVFVFVFAVYYSVSTLAAMLWRSAIVSIIVAVLFWAACFTVGITKSSLETLWLNGHRTAAIIPVDDDLLVTDWAGNWSQWNDASGRFREILSGEGQTLAALTGYPFLGPLYDARHDRLVAVQVPLQAGFTPPLLMVAESEDGFVPLLGELLPVDVQSLLLDESGSIIVAGQDGLFRFDGNLTIDLQNMQRLDFGVEDSDEDEPLVRVDDRSISWSTPFDAAVDPQSGRLAVVSGNEIRVLEPDEESNFDVVESTEREDSTTAVVGIAGDVVLVAGEDGVIRILSRSTLNQRDEFQPFGNREPRDVTASPDGRWLAVQFHSRHVWLYDVEESSAVDAPLRAQGNISAVAFDSDSTLYAGDGFGRVIQYRPEDDFAEVRRWEPEATTLESLYEWVISPLYRVFPKPGEMDNLVSWLMTRKAAPVEEDEEDELGFDPARETQRAAPNIWQPLWSNLAFLAVMLSLTCVYFTRKEF